MEKPDKATREKWHNDSTNWKLGMFYFNREDKRLFVPKIMPILGWTINFANPYFIGVLDIILILYLTTV